MLNIYGRSRKEQADLNARLAPVSLWGELPGEDVFVFTQTEFDKAAEARMILDQFKKKLLALAEDGA
jgi:hypothetical protein